MREHTGTVQEEFGAEFQPLDLFADIGVPLSPGTNEVDEFQAEALLRDVFRAHR